MAAVSTVAVSVGTGTVAAGTAFILISSSSVANAEITGPKDGQGRYLKYSDPYIYKYLVDLPDALAGRNWVSFPIAGAVDEEGYPITNYELYLSAARDMMLDEQINGAPVGIKSTVGTNLKITLDGAGASENVRLSTDTDIRSATLWVTGTGNSLSVGQTGLTQSITDIYVDKVALQFTGSYGGTNELHASFHLGVSNYVAAAGSPLNGSTLVIGSDSDKTPVSVSTTGDLEVDSEGAKIGFNNAAVLTIRGALTGSGALELASKQGGAGSLYLLGGSKDFTGIIDFGSTQGTSLYLGANITMGGLVGSAADVNFRTSGVGAVTLTLNVTSGNDYLLTGTPSDGSRTSQPWASGIKLQKEGMGSQTIYNFSGSGVDVKAGHLTLGGTAISIGSQGVAIGGRGTLTFNGSANDVLVSFAPGAINISEGRMEIVASDGHLAPAANLREVTLNVGTGAEFVAEGEIVLGEVNLRGGSIALTGTTDLDYASMRPKEEEKATRLKFESGSLTLGGFVKNLRNTIELGSGMTLTVEDGLKIDLSSLGDGYTVADLSKHTFSYVVNVVDATSGAKVNGWAPGAITFTDRYGEPTKYEALTPSGGYYSAGVSYTDAVIVQELGTSKISWRNGRNVEGVQTWADGKSSLVVRTKPGDAGSGSRSVTFITGEDDPNLTSGAKTDMEYYQRRAVNIFIDNNNEMILRQAVNNFVNASGTGTSVQYLGDLTWKHMLLMGTLTLKDRDVLGRPDEDHPNTVDCGPNALVVVDWRSDGKGIVGSYANRGRYIGSSENLPVGYNGKLEVRSGVFSQSLGDSFSEIVVKSGGQLSFDRFGGNTPPEDRVFNGKVTLSGSGLVNMDVGESNREAFASALKLIGEVKLNGTVTIADAATIHGWINETAYINGELVGAGLGELTFTRVEDNTSTATSTLVVNGTVNGIKLFNINQYSLMDIRSDFSAANIDEATVESRRFKHMTGSGTLRFSRAFTGFDRITVGGNGTLELASMADDNGVPPTFGADIIDFVKDGAGMLDINRHFDIPGTVSILGGTLRFGDSSTADYRLGARHIRVGNSCTFVITHAPTAFNTDITLDGATMKNGSGWVHNGADGHSAPYFKFGKLTLQGSRSDIAWMSDSGSSTDEGFYFESVTGSGDLNVAQMTNGPLYHQFFRVDEINNYSGTIYLDINSGNNLARTKQVYIGQVHQDSGWNGAVDIKGAPAYSDCFRKTGGGSFEITRLELSDEVWMNYEGSFDVDTVKFSNDMVLHYTSGDNNRVILTEGVESDSSVDRLYIDLLDLSAEQLNLGVNLGFYSNVENALKLFEEKLVVGGYAKGDYTLYTQEGRLYLKSSKPIDQTWDRAMGVKSLAFAPTAEQLEKDGTFGAQYTTGDYFELADLESHEGDRYNSTKNNQSITFVRLVSSSNPEVSVVGGLNYDKRDGAGEQDLQSYLLLSGATYHMLVGGSMNSDSAASASTGFFGGSHIQVDSGTVDYIVAGNHYSSGGFSFEGDSYVSVRTGSVKGGIVGGNTYAGGGGDFTGDSHIFIYTALSNAASTPLIDKNLDAAEAFTSVVGGSAYVGDAAVRTGITFTGNSEIVVDLSNNAATGAFGKSIVGGNAYFTKKTWSDTTGVNAWNSTFVGDSSISINGKSTVFQGVVAGAMHHDINGAQRVTFLGDTSVSISGGVFKDAVAGGSYHGSSSTGAYSSIIEGDTNVSISGGTFWRVTGGSYVLSSNLSEIETEDGIISGRSIQTGDSSVTISGGTFNHTSQKSAAAANARAESYRSFVAGGRYLAGNRGDDSAHVLDGSAYLTVTGGSFSGSVLVGGDFFSATVPGGLGRYPNAASAIELGTFVEVSSATITDGVVVGGSYLTDSSQGGSITISAGTHLTIGAGAKISSSTATSLSGIAAVGGSYLDVSGADHTATTEDGTNIEMKGGEVTGHIVGGSVLTGYANKLTTVKTISISGKTTEVKSDSTVTLTGGTVKGNVYGGHFVGSAGSDPAFSAISVMGDTHVTLDGAAVTGNIYGGGSFSCAFGYGSDEYKQTQENVTVSLLSGTLTGDVYAAGALGRPAEIKQGNSTMQPEGALVTTASTRVEVGSALSFGKASSTVSGDYHLTDGAFKDYHNEAIAGGRTLAFVDSGNYAAVKNISGVAFRKFDTIEVAAGGNVSLSAQQFVGESGGFTKSGEGSLTLGGALATGGKVAVHGGTLVLEKKQNLSGGLHFDLTGRTSNDAASAFLQGKSGYAAGTVDVYLDMTAAQLESVGFGFYYLASNWDESTLSWAYGNGWPQATANSSREFRLGVQDGCLVLQVRENSKDPWLWRGDTHHPVVGAYEWDSAYSANWNAHEMEETRDNASLTPEGKDVKFTASVGGEVLVGELVHPASVTVSSGNYVFRQRSPEDGEGIEGIWTDRLTVGGSVQEAVLELALANRNINNIFLENGGTLILSDEDAITSSLQRKEYNSIIYFNGGKLVYGDEFSKDISYQISEQGIGTIRIDVEASHVDPDIKNGVTGTGAIMWGKLFDSENPNTWSDNPGVRQSMRDGIEKGGEGTLRFLWGSSVIAYGNHSEQHTSDSAGRSTYKLSRNTIGDSDMVSDIDVKAGSLEMLMNGAGADPDVTFRFRGNISVEADAQMVFWVQRQGVVHLEETLSGEGTIILGRQIGYYADRNDTELTYEESTYTRLGVIRCTVNSHGGAYMPGDAGAPYVISGRNTDFAGTIVLEGDSSREARNYVQLGQRYQENPLAVSGFDKNAEITPEEERKFNYSRGGVMVALGGGQTTLVLAGRHLTTTGMISYANHEGYYNSPILEPVLGDESMLAAVDWQMFGEKLVRTGTVHVKEGTINYVGSSCQDSETDNGRLAASSYRRWDDEFAFTGKLTGSGVLAIVWGYAPEGSCGGYNPSSWRSSWSAWFAEGGTYEELGKYFPFWSLSGVGGYYSHRWLGPISEFEGTIVAGDLASNRDGRETSGASWTFSASSAAAEAGERSIVRATLGGCGTMYFNYTQDTVLAGAIGDATHGYLTDIVNLGSGKIILGSSKNISTGSLYLQGGDIDLGDDTYYGKWVGTDIRGNAERSFTFVNGEIASPLKRREGSEVRFRVETSALAATRVNAGGTLCGDLYEVIINKDGFLTGVYGDLIASRDDTRVRLVFSKNNVGATAAGQHMIELRYNRSLVVKDTDYFVMDFGVDSIVDLLKEQASAPQAERYLHVLEKGTLDIPNTMWDDLLVDGGDGARLLSQLGLYIDRVENGEIVMKAVGGHRAYYVFADSKSSDSHTVDHYDILSGYEAVIVEAGQTLSINLMGSPEYGTRDYLAGGAVVPNLWGDRGSRVNVTNTNPNRGRVTIIFENADPYDGTLNSTFLGTIYGGDSVDFVKSGAGTITIGYHDRWDTSGGFYGDNLELRKGGVVLQGKENEVRDKLTFNYGTESETNGLTLLYGDTTIGQIVEKSDKGATITMGGDATLTLTSEADSVWGNIVLQRESDQSTGSLILEAGSVDLASTKKTQLKGVHLSLLGDSKLTINCLDDASVGSLNGSGTLTANVSGTLKVTGEKDALFTGTLVSADEAENTLHITGGLGVMTMRNVRNEQLWNLHNDGKIILDVSGQNSPSKEISNNLAFGYLTLGELSTTTYYINPDNVKDGVLAEMLTSTGFKAEAKASFIIESVGDYRIYDGDDLIIANLGETEDGFNGVYTELYGFSFLLSKTKEIYVDNTTGDLHLSLEKRDRNDNIYSHPNQEANAAAGAKLFWNALWEPTRLRNLSGDEGQDLREMLVSMDKLMKQGNIAALDKALAAGAGAAISTLGPALAQDLERQLRAIRNRTTSMGANPNYAVGDGPQYHAWINAESNYHKMESDGLAPGFTSSSWGGTVGMDVDVNGRSTVGLALTAMYGNLDTDAADKGDGKVDTYYLSFFGKTSRGRWSHTVVGSIGLANVSLDRTIDYGGDTTCSTSGSTNGYSFGIMYEVGYAIPMNSEASYALQPMANVTLRHVGISGYEETGHGAQLRVGDISHTVFTLGAGVRAQAVIGENAYNRTSILEGRVIAKVDVGDSKGKSENALVYGSTNTTAAVESAELGAVGLEIGVGVTVPMDNAKGSLFVDASAELRSGYTNLNATIGYRMDF